MEHAYSRPDINEHGTLDALGADDVDQFLQGGMRSAAAPLVEILRRMVAIVAEEIEVLLATVTARLVERHNRMVRRSVKLR